MAVLPQREREHISDTVFFAVNAVESADFLITDERNADLSVLLEVFGYEDCLTAAPYQKTDSNGNPLPLLDCFSP